MKLTSVVNVKTEQFDVYIGRSGFGYEGLGFGNPFTIKQAGNREEAIRLYRRWLWNRIKTDYAFRLKVKSLKGKRLGCWCKPCACHGDVLAAAAEWLNKLPKVKTRKNRFEHEPDGEVKMKRMGWNSDTPVPPAYLEPPAITTTRHEALLYGDSEAKRNRR